jgi:hypothetical protein
VRQSLVLLAALALPWPAVASAQPGADEHVVFRAVLARLIEPDVRRIAVSDSTFRSQMNLESRFRASPNSSINLLQRRTGPLPDALFEDYNRRNQSRVAVPAPLDLPVPVELLSEAELDSLYSSIPQDERDSQFDFLRRHLSGAPGVVSLSRPGFTAEGDIALILVKLACGSRCGTVWFAVLRGRGGEWQVEHWIRISSA